MLSNIAYNVAVRPVVSIATTMKNNPVKTTLVAAAAAYAVARTYDVDAINQFEGKVSELAMPYVNAAKEQVMPYLTSAKETVLPYVNSTAETVAPYYASVKNTVTNITAQISNAVYTRLENAGYVGTHSQNQTNRYVELANLYGTSKNPNYNPGFFANIRALFGF